MRPIIRASASAMRMVVSLRGGARRKTPAKIGGREPEAAIEGAAEGIVAAKADGARDRAYRRRRGGQVVAGGIEPEHFDLLGRRHAEHAAELAAELPRAESRSRREPLDRQVLVQVCGE